MKNYVVCLRYDCEKVVKVEAETAKEAIEKVQSAIDCIKGKEIDAVSNIIKTEEYIEDTLYIDDDEQSVEEGNEYN